jgi:uncharacterized protein YjiS (DUF1127 family)
MSARNLNLQNLPGAVRDAAAPAAWERAAIRALGTLRLWARRWRQRAELRITLEREPRFFADIGIPRDLVYKEARKWFWRA